MSHCGRFQMRHSEILAWVELATLGPPEPPEPPGGLPLPADAIPSPANP